MMQDLSTNHCLLAFFRADSFNKPLDTWDTSKLWI
jgi:hypothetical protein